MLAPYVYSDYSLSSVARTSAASKLSFTSCAECIIVIEKEGIYARLVEDRWVCGRINSFFFSGNVEAIEEAN